MRTGCGLLRAPPAPSPELHRTQAALIPGTSLQGANDQSELTCDTALDCFLSLIFLCTYLLPLS